MILRILTATKSEEFLPHRCRNGEAQCLGIVIPPFTVVGKVFPNPCFAIQTLWDVWQVKAFEIG